MLYLPGFGLIIPKPTSVCTVSALGVGGNGLWTKIIVAHTLKWPLGLVCRAACLKKKKSIVCIFRLVGLVFTKGQAFSAQ